MSVTTRQTRLLVAEDWQRVYQSFRNADFTSYDFENLRRVMIDYIRINYPEDFNDYIESSEYLALIDLIAFLGQSIAFRVDLNARENFLELAERRDSVLRLARLISYNAKRNQAANGLLKFSTVSTTENVIDGTGRNIAGQVVSWNDPSNPNWYDQFIKILNASFPQTQQFGSPADSNTIYSIPTEQYRFESIDSGIPVYSFSKTVAGRTMNFEIVSTTFKGQSFLYEEAPAAGNPLACVYRDDGRGAASPGSGFFLHFVQGSMNTGVFTITQPSSSESVDIEAQNINNNDVWLYKLDQQGLETELWTPVSNFESNNVIYNSLNKDIRNIYAVITRATDAISLQFSDGTFGNVPIGTFRTYYRVSNGLEYSISPQDIQNVSFSLPYLSAVGQPETLTITLSLAFSVVNASASESNDSIKANAPATFYTQNRMITGEDYNISPLSVNTNVAKIKSINRTSSGISRYFDLIDPTGKYSSTTLFADDGIIYKEDVTNSTRFSYITRTDIEGIIYNTVFPILEQKNLRNFYYSNFINFITTSLDIQWTAVTTDVSSSSGAIVDSTGITSIYKLGSFTTTDLKYFTSGALIKFVAPAGQYFDTLKTNKLTPLTGGSLPAGALQTLWASVVSVVDDGTAAGAGILSTGFGPVTLNTPVPSGAVVTQIIPKWRTVLNSDVITTMIELIDSNKPFGLRYDATTQTWKIIFESNLNLANEFSLGQQGSSTNQQLDSSWLLLFTTDNEFYTVSSRELQYVFESDKQIRFYFENNQKIYDSKTSSTVKDYINILNVNTVPDSINSFTTNQKWEVVSEYRGLDGYVDNKKLIVTFTDSDENGAVDNPELFINVVIGDISIDYVNVPSKYIVLEKYVISPGQEDYRYIDNAIQPVVTILPTKPSSFLITDDGKYFYFVDIDTVFKFTWSTSTLSATLDYKLHLGRANLKFQYNHSANAESRIDSGASNIIDVYILTRSYDTNFRQWLAGASIVRPLPPGSNELGDTLSTSLNLIKSISDEIVYHPVSYKILFGASASNDLQASFKVIKNSNVVVSDNDIKSRVITAINQFFALENWDFGDTFYFTELATYVVTQLSPDISSFVIVPRQGGLSFGSLFEITADSTQLFISSATVADIDIITGITASSIKAIAGTTAATPTTVQQVITSSTYGSN
jgi:hypothetical protein